MSKSSEPVASELSTPGGDRSLHLRRRLRGHFRAEDGSAFSFGVRLLATAALTFVVIGITGFVLLERNLAQRQITDYASAQRADGRALEQEGMRAVSRV